MATIPAATQAELLYPALAQARPTLAELGAAVAPIELNAGTVLFRENSACQGFPLVLGGEVKVSRNSMDGRTLELYRVVPGELCLVSSSCLFRAQPLARTNSDQQQRGLAWAGRVSRVTFVTDTSTN